MVLPCRPSNALLLNLLKIILRCRDLGVVMGFSFVVILDVAMESVVCAVGSWLVTSSVGSTSSVSPEELRRSTDSGCSDAGRESSLSGLESSL